MPNPADPVEHPPVRVNPSERTVGTWSIGMTVREVLDLPSMSSAEVLAGEEGLDRVVERLNMMEVPDVLPWVRDAEMLVTSGYPLRDLTPRQFARLIRELSHRGLAGICLKLGRFVLELPTSVRRAANSENFPVVAMPAQLSFTDLLAAVLAAQLQRQEAAMRASDEIDRLLLQILVAGGGHQEISDRVADWLGVPVSIVDVNGLILGSAPSPPAAHLLVAGDGTRLRVDGLPRDPHDPLAFDGLMAAACIQSGSAVQGYLVADGQGQGLTPGQLLAVRRAAPVVALAFARSSEIQAVEAGYRGDFLRAVITDTTRPGDDRVGHARLLGWDLRGEMLVGVGEPSSDVRAEAVGQACVQISRAMAREICTRWPGSAVHGYATEIVVITTVQAKAELEGIMRGARAHLTVAERSFRLGLSRPVFGAEGLPTGYRQAREALLAARHEPDRSGPLSFDDIGLARLVAVIAESGQGPSLLSDLLSPLLADRLGEELLLTLEQFLATNCNVAATARALHFHYNTVRYRVGRIEELLGPFVDHAERRAELITALSLRRRLLRDM